MLLEWNGRDIDFFKGKMSIRALRKHPTVETTVIARDGRKSNILTIGNKVPEARKDLLTCVQVYNHYYRRLNVN